MEISFHSKVHKKEKASKSQIPGFLQVLVGAARREGKERRGCGFRMWLLDSLVNRTGVICLVVKDLSKYNAKRNRGFFALGWWIMSGAIPQDCFLMPNSKIAHCLQW